MSHNSKIIKDEEMLFVLYCCIDLVRRLLKVYYVYMLGSKTDFGQWTEKVAKTRSGRQHTLNQSYMESLHIFS